MLIYPKNKENEPKTKKMSQNRFGMNHNSNFLSQSVHKMSQYEKSTPKESI